MTQEKGIPYQRHKPSAALREFLDPLDPGSYFDCGRARLRGLDDALLAEARSRGRAIGDDSFQLVATDMGVIYCRPSISFAIAARWADVTIARPRGDDPVVLAITWPTHGELKFTVSNRLAGNVFRRWLQLRVQADRLHRETAVEHEEDQHEPAATASRERVVETVAPLAQRSAEGGDSSTEETEQRVQGKDRVAATVAEAASVVVNRQRRSAAKVPAPPRDRDLATVEVDGGGPETWEVVAKVAAPVRREAAQPGKPTKLDRRQNADALRRKRQEKAGDSRRRRRPANTDPSQSPRSRWFSDLDPANGSSVQAYDIPPLQSPDPSRPMRPAVKLPSPPALRSDGTADVDNANVPEADEVPSGRPADPDPAGQIDEKKSDPSSTPAMAPDSDAIPAAELVDQLLAADQKPKTYRGPSAMPRALRAKPAAPGSDRAARIGRSRRSERIDKAVAEAGVFGPERPSAAKPSETEASEVKTPSTKPPAVESSPTIEPQAIERPSAEPSSIERPAAEPKVAAVTGENRTPAGEPSLPALLAVQKPVPPEPSWIGSPVSLVAAMVVISTFVLIGAVAVGSYRRSAEVAAGVSPAGPAVSIIDHQRFRTDVDTGPTASELGQPEASRYSETTSPPSTIGSGSAPIAAKPAWPPADGPQTCNSNYSGCVPDVSDVDCPNDGDGPIYWSESARVMGEDVYELDTDGDGEICEPDQPPLVSPDGGSGADPEPATDALSSTADE